ncbi:hypothetical protein AN1V17_50840 [Vallitalea sediminicola]
MRKIVLLIMTIVITSYIFVGCKELEKLDRDKNVVANIEVSDNNYTDRDNVEVANDEQFEIYLTGTTYSMFSKRSLLIQVENKTDKDVSIKIQSATIDGKEQQAVYTEEKIAAKEKTRSGAIVFNEKLDFETSAGEVVVYESNSENILGTYKYNIKIVDLE